MSEVFYRRWRPQTLNDIVGQEHVTRTLLNALKTGRVSHAYLFCGPRGTGKTSTSRILAKAVNCLNNEGNSEPCNTCHMCQAITEGRAMDVIEIDAASNTGVDDIRSLKEKVAYSPSEGRYKVYIVDEVHMLSNNASNALLKTLEEPPPRVIFILATTESHKLLPTILSRCQRFDFKRLSYGSIVKKLSDICQNETIKFEPEALTIIARSATGSLRDAENLLEQVTSYYGREINKSQVQSVLGNSGTEYARRLVAHITNGDTAAGLEEIVKAEADGVDLKQFAGEITGYLRGLLLVKSGCSQIADFTPEEIADLKKLATAISRPDLIKATRQFGDVKIEGYSTLPLELALLEATLDEQKSRVAISASPAPQPKAPKQIRSRNQAARPVPDTAPPSPPPGQDNIEASARETDGAIAVPPQPEHELRAETPPEDFKPVAKPVAETETVGPPALETCSEYELLCHNWNQMLEKAPDSAKRTVAVALLRSSVRLVSLENDVLVLAFKFKIHKDRMELAANKKVACQVISSYLGRPVTIQCIHEPEKNYLVQAAQDKLGARITNVEEK